MRVSHIHGTAVDSPSTTRHAARVTLGSGVLGFRVSGLGFRVESSLERFGLSFFWASKSGDVSACRALLRRAGLRQLRMLCASFSTLQLVILDASYTLSRFFQTQDRAKKQRKYAGRAC